jgi:hypothetical protein
VDPKVKLRSGAPGWSAQGSYDLVITGWTLKTPRPSFFLSRKEKNMVGAETTCEDSEYMGKNNNLSCAEMLANGNCTNGHKAAQFCKKTCGVCGGGVVTQATPPVSTVAAITPPVTVVPVTQVTPPGSTVAAITPPGSFAPSGTIAPISLGCDALKRRNLAIASPHECAPIVESGAFAIVSVTIGPSVYRVALSKQGGNYSGFNAHVAGGDVIFVEVSGGKLKYVRSRADMRWVTETFSSAVAAKVDETATHLKYDAGIADVFVDKMHVDPFAETAGAITLATSPGSTVPVTPPGSFAPPRTSAPISLGCVALKTNLAITSPHECAPIVEADASALVSVTIGPSVYRVALSKKGANYSGFNAHAGGDAIFVEVSDGKLSYVRSMANMNWATEKVDAATVAKIGENDTMSEYNAGLALVVVYKTHDDPFAETAAEVEDVGSVAKKGSGLGAGAITGIVLGVLCALALLAFVWWWYRGRDDTHVPFEKLRGRVKSGIAATRARLPWRAHND